MRPKHISRRGFLGALGGAVAAGTGVAASSWGLPDPSSSGVEHIILVMMENRSFDHFVGWLPGADGKQSGLVYRDTAGAPHPTWHLSDYQGCAYKDPDHSYEGGRIEYDGGRCDGWLLDPQNDIFSIGYYGRSDLPFLGAAAPAWTVCDRYFAAIMAETYPNRIYQHAAQTDRLHNSSSLCTLPTIWDELLAAGVSARYYFSDAPFLALWGARYLPISHLFPQFLADCAAGTLPHVSFIDPRFEDESTGTSGDDHPHGDIRNGEAFLNQVYTAVTSGPLWDRTVLVLNFDEWGGFFDHVPPPAMPIPTADRLAGNSDGLLGFRVPALLASPFARRGYVSHVPFDHTSVLKLIEWRWGLPPLTIRDTLAPNLAWALDLSRKDTTAPQLAVPPGPYGGVCPAGLPAPAGDEWATLAALATQLGFPA